MRCVNAGGGRGGRCERSARGALYGPRRSGLSRRWVLVAVGLLAAVIVLALVLAPAIAGAVAPGLITSAAKGSIAGTVRVDRVGLSWTGPQRLTGVRVADPSGREVANVNVSISSGLLGLIASGGRGDLGTVRVGGTVAVERQPDGQTNIEAATAPVKAEPAPENKAPAKAPQGLKVAVVIEGLDVTYREVGPQGAVVREAAIKGLKGDSAVDLAQAGGRATVNLDATVTGTAGSGPLVVKADVANFVGADGTIQPAGAKGTAQVQGGALPVALIDALARQNGLLEAAIGPALTLDVDARAEGPQGGARVKATGANLDADLALALADGRLRSTGASRVAIKSTAFAERVPAVRDALGRAGLTLAAWPGVTLDLRGLDIPAGGGGGGGGAADQLDFRGAKVDAALSVGAFEGTLAPPAAAGQAAAPSRRLALAPLMVEMASADLAGPVTVRGQTQASVDGQAAGRLMADVAADGLLDDAGRLVVLKGGQPKSVTGRVEAAGITAEVLQPFLAAANVPMNVREDLGPTLDVAADLKQGAEGLDVDARVMAERLKAQAPVRWAGKTLSSRGPVTVALNGSVNAVNRVLARGGGGNGGTPPVVLSGRGGIEATVTDLSVPMAAGFDLGTLAANVQTRVSDIAVSMPNNPAPPLAIRSLVGGVAIKPGQPIAVTGDGQMDHEGRAFAVKTNLSIAGLPEALKAGQALPGVGPVRVGGSVDVTNMPASVARLAVGGGNAAAGGQPGGANAAGNAGADAGGSAVAELIRAMVGEVINAQLRFDGAQGGQRVSAAVRGSGLSTDLAAELTPQAIKVDAINAEATVRPETAQSLLRAAGQTGPALQQIAMQQPARLSVQVAPVTVPVQIVGGTPKPQLDRLEQIEVNAKLLDTLVITGIPAGERRMSGGLRGFTAQAVVPGAILAGGGGGGGGKRLTATASGDLMLDANRRVAGLALNATAAPDGSGLDATVGLTQIDTQAADGVLGEPGIVSGALGNQASVTLKATRAAKDQPLAASFAVESPQLTTGSLAATMAADRVTVAGPAQVNWTVQPAWAERFLLAGRDERGAPTPPTLRLTEPVRVTMDLRTLTIATSQNDAAGQPVSGPLKPGVFAVDAQVSVPAVGVQTMSRGGGRGGPAGPTADPLMFRDVRATLATTPAGGVGLQASVGQLVQGGVTTPNPVTVKAEVRNLADQRGVVNAQAATVNLDVVGERVPVALLDQLGGLNGQAVSTLGTTMALNVRAVDASRAGGAVNVQLVTRGLPPALVAQGRLPRGLNPDAELASLALGGPIRGGVLDLGAGQALNARLTQFRYDVDTDVLKLFPLFASASKSAWAGPGNPPPGRGPAVVASRDLRVPVDGDMRKLNGAVQVDIGVVEYTFREVLGEFLDSTIFTGNGEEGQKPIEPFTVTFVNGVASYDKFEIPIRNFFIKNRGTIDLVNRQVDVITYIPTVAASKGLLAKVNTGASQGLGKVLPDVLSEGTMIPLRVRGPMDKPSYSIDFELFFKEFGNNLVKEPGKLIEGVLDNLLKPRR